MEKTVSLGGVGWGEEGQKYFFMFACVLSIQCICCLRSLDDVRRGVFSVTSTANNSVYKQGTFERCRWHLAGHVKKFLAHAKFYFTGGLISPGFTRDLHYKITISCLVLLYMIIWPSHVGCGHRWL